MAVHHPATIVPGTLELLQAWVPHQPWLDGADATTLTRLGSYRFDDPAGQEDPPVGGAQQVGLVPLTYRGAPRAAAEDSLITTMTHTTLGDRWIPDGCSDPVYVTALVTTILTGGREADLFRATADGLVQEAVTTRVRGSGSSPTAGVPVLHEPDVTHEGARTRIDAGLGITLLRTPTVGTARSLLTGTWPGQSTALLLAAA